MDGVKKIFLDNLIVIFICLYIVVYFCVNYETIKMGVFPVVLAKPFLISSITTVLLYLVFTFDETENVAVTTGGLVKPIAPIAVKQVIEHPPMEIVKNNVFIPHASRGQYGLRF